jgi:hypothetical protein
VIAVPSRNPVTSACEFVSEPAKLVNSVLSRVDSWVLVPVETDVPDEVVVCAITGATDSAPSTAMQISVDLIGVDLKRKEFMGWLRRCNEGDMPDETTVHFFHAPCAPNLPDGRWRFAH